MDAARPRPDSRTPTAGGAPLHVAVVGGGAGGLSAAVHLAARGARVTLLERADSLGGKARGEKVVGRTAAAGSTDGPVGIDAGPTVITLPQVFRDLYAAAGERLEDHVSLRPAEVLARHFFPGGEVLDLFADADRSAEAIAAVFGAAEADGFRRFATHARAIHRIVEGPFIHGQRPTMLGTLRTFGLGALPDLMRIDGMRTLWAALGDFFRTPQLRQLFGRYATYVGSSPLEAPGTLAVIAGVELAGVYCVDGGIRRLMAEISALAARLGVELVTGAEVTEIRVEAGRVTGLHLAGGARLDCDAVVVAADAAAVVEGRFGAAAREAVRLSGTRSLSAVTLTGLVATGNETPALSHHNVFFGTDGPAEFEALFGARRIGPDPTLYVCAQDRAPTVVAPPARTPERMLALINAPALTESPQPWPPPPESTSNPTHAATHAPTTDALHRTLLTLLERRDLRPHAPRTVALRTPADWAAAHPGSGGALYGQASHGWRQAFLRPGARTRLPGLYLAGGTVHPGAGLPMATASGQRAAEALWADRPST
jgi:1-hydroxycarotenoid 3,4-desaturase